MRLVYLDSDVVVDGYPLRSDGDLRLFTTKLKEAIVNNLLLWNVIVEEAKETPRYYQENQTDLIVCIPGMQKRWSIFEKIQKRDVLTITSLDFHSNNVTPVINKLREIEIRSGSVKDFV